MPSALLLSPAVPPSPPPFGILRSWPRSPAVWWRQSALATAMHAVANRSQLDQVAEIITPGEADI